MKNKSWIAEITSYNDDETWKVDIEADTKEEVVRLGMERAIKENQPRFRVGQVNSVGVATIDAENILENAQEQIYDEVGESSEGNYLDDISNEQEKELEEKLNEVFYEWHKKHNLFPTCFNVDNAKWIYTK